MSIAENNVVSINTFVPKIQSYEHEIVQLVIKELKTLRFEFEGIQFARLMQTLFFDSKCNLGTLIQALGIPRRLLLMRVINCLPDILKERRLVNSIHANLAELYPTHYKT